MAKRKKVETLSAIGETLLALLHQLTGKPGIKPSEAKGLIQELERIQKLEPKLEVPASDPDEPIAF